MISLIVATISAAMFAILFRVFQLKGIDSFKAIMVNYAVAFLWGCLLSFNGNAVHVNLFSEKWFYLALLIGVIFIRGMVLLNICTEKVGVAISTVCSRASMVITIVFCYLCIPGNEKPDWLAIAFALVALVMIVTTDMRSVVDGHGKRYRSILLTVVVFLIFGLSNSLLKLMQYMMDQEFSAEGDDVLASMNAVGTSVIFITALVVGVLTEVVSRMRKGNGNDGKRMGKGEIAGGFALGSVNFFCTYLLVIAMKSIDSSILFPVHNAGIVALGAVAGWAVFGEKLTKMQIAGIAIAIISIVWLCI